MSAELAILGLLVEQPLHGYGIQRLIEQRGMRKWTPIGFSSIYQQLDQIVSKGLAEVRTEPAPGRGKQRRVHHVTPLGHERWAAATVRGLSEVTEHDGEFLLALAGLPLLEGTQALTALRDRRSSLESQIEGLDADLELARPVPDHVAAMFDYTRAQLTAADTWLKEFLHDLEARHQEVQA